MFCAVTTKFNGRLHHPVFRMPAAMALMVRSIGFIQLLG
jgi:acyl dehydratase